MSDHQEQVDRLDRAVSEVQARLELLAPLVLRVVPALREFLAQQERQAPQDPLD